MATYEYKGSFSDFFMIFFLLRIIFFQAILNTLWFESEKASSFKVDR